MKESLLVTLTLENNEDGEWALYARFAGEPVRMSHFFNTKEELIESLKVQPASTHITWDKEGNRIVTPKS